MGTKRALRIEERLPDAPLANIEAGGAKDARPLLAFTMERLYVEYGGDGDLTVAEYHSLVGKGASRGWDRMPLAVLRSTKRLKSDGLFPRDAANQELPWLTRP
jgi:hypothetical protein